MDERGTYDVLILGYGPVGAALANLLGQAGHSVAVADMHRQVFDMPRAVNLDQEALRLFQRIGLAEKISEGCAMHPGTDFVGADGELIKSIRSASPPYPLAWPANIMFVQPEAEKTLRAHVGMLETVDEYLEHTAVAFEQTDDTVAVSFDTPSGIKTLRARYLIGCDGANSPTRNWIGATQTDLGFSEHWVVVDAWLQRETPLPPRTTQYCNPKAPTSYVVCSDNLRRWEMKILPGENFDEYNNIEKVKARLAPFVDVDALKFWRTAVYHFDAKVADKWHDRRVFLAGDAAHTMPPFLGQGLNSGLRDVANLSWKLSRVLLGLSDESLLSSYQTERRPHIFALTEITKDLGQIVGETDTVKAAERDILLRAEMAEHGVITVRQALIPAISDGFFDAKGDELKGSLAPQPRVVCEGETHLLDDLMSGFSMVEPASSHRTLKVSTSVEGNSISSFECEDTQELMIKFLADHDLAYVLIRPDGVIWSAGLNPAKAVQRLHSKINRPVLETNP